MNITKHIVAVLLVALMALSIQAQSKEERRTQKKTEKALKKEERAKALKANKERILASVENKSFVIEANTLYDRYQNRYPVAPTVNFVKIDGDQGVVQFGFSHAIGYNGVGGLTFAGRLSGYKVMDTKPGGPITISANLTSPGLLGTATILLSIHNDGSARATVTGSYGSRLTFDGDFFELEESHIYEGTTIL